MLGLTDLDTGPVVEGGHAQPATDSCRFRTHCTGRPRCGNAAAMVTRAAGHAADPAQDNLRQSLRAIISGRAISARGEMASSGRIANSLVLVA